jgi:hypothetical protein
MLKYGGYFVIKKSIFHVVSKQVKDYLIKKSDLHNNKQIQSKF